MAEGLLNEEVMPGHDTSGFMGPADKRQSQFIYLNEAAMTSVATHVNKDM